MSENVLKLILRRFALKLGDRIWSGWLSALLFTLFLGLLMYVLSDYECPIRRALGYPTEKQSSYSVFFHLREHNCEPPTVKP
jgi:hypothetical protein